MPEFSDQQRRSIFSMQPAIRFHLANVVCWPVIPLAGLIHNRYFGCVERQVTGLTRSFRE